MIESEAKYLHIVAFTVPYPPDYGGIIDVYFKIRTFHQMGIKIFLHCFDYGRGQQKELEEICEKVFYYKRKPMWLGLLTKEPLLVHSRRNKKLLHHLMADPYPVLLEGLHCCAYLPHLAAADKRVFIRMHNNEPEYYAALGKAEKNRIKKIYFDWEAKRLFRFEKVLQYAHGIFCISKKETAFYQTKYKNTFYTGPFHGNSQLNIHQGKGSYVLFHGNLSVPENVEAVKFIVSQVYPIRPFSLVIAGNRPDTALRNYLSQFPKIELIANPDHADMNRLIEQAQVHLLVSKQPTGVKLKLINALFNGRFIVANAEMVQGVDVERFISVANTPMLLSQAVHECLSKPFTEAEMAMRREVESELSNQKAIAPMKDLLWQDV